MTMELSSSAFADGEAIPRQYGHDEANVNPPLSVSGIPDDATSLALVVDDPDAVEPAGKVWGHWTVWNVPPDVTEIPEDWTPSVEGADEGTNDFDEHGYGGPAPPDREHTYQFKLYALDATLDLSPEAGREEVESAIEGSVVDEAVLEGTYAP